MEVRIMRGGRGGGRGVVVGPAAISSPYDTTANGRADEIFAAPGEIAVRIRGADGHRFAVWVAGPKDIVVEELHRRCRTARAAGDHAEANRLCVVALEASRAEVVTTASSAVAWWTERAEVAARLSRPRMRSVEDGAYNAVADEAEASGVSISRR